MGVSAAPDLDKKLDLVPKLDTMMGWVFGWVGLMRG